MLTHSYVSIRSRPFERAALLRRHRRPSTCVFVNLAAGERLESILNSFQGEPPRTRWRASPSRAACSRAGRRRLPPERSGRRRPRACSSATGRAWRRRRALEHYGTERPCVMSFSASGTDAYIRLAFRLFPHLRGSFPYPRSRTSSGQVFVSGRRAKDHDVDRSQRATAPARAERPPPASDIKPISIADEMRRSYLDYAMSVIVSRARCPTRATA